MKPATVLTERRMKVLLGRHLKDTGEAKGAAVIQELCVAGFARRADMVLVNGKLSVFEIKGERDDLNRLPGQIETFSHYFETVTVVCAPKHTSRVLEVAPARVGVWEISNDHVTHIRVSQFLPKRDMRVWLSYLPVREIRSLLVSSGISAPRTRRDHLLDLAETLNIEDVRHTVLRYLKTRVRTVSKFKPSGNKPRKIGDVTAQNVARVQEYLNMINSSGGSLKAMPRKRKAVAVDPQNSTSSRS